MIGGMKRPSHQKLICSKKILTTYVLRGVQELIITKEEALSLRT